MKQTALKIITFFFILFFINVTYSQENKINVKFIGNCGLYLSDGSLNIYVDFPYKSGAHRYMEYDLSEVDNVKDSAILLFTHRHSDHYSKKQLKKTNGKIYTPWNVDELEELNSKAKDFSIQAYRTKHKFTLKHYSYLIIWHNKKIFLSGDTGNITYLSNIDNLDWVFAPFWIYRNAMDQSVAIDTKMFGIYHLYPNQKIGEGFPENVHFFMTQGEIISIPF